MKLKAVLITTLIITILAVPLFAEETEDFEKLGQKMTEDVWVLMKAGNVDQLKEMMADGFQSLHQDGSRNLDEQLALIAGLSLGEYKLTDFKVTMAENTIVATYFVSVRETIDGERLDSEPAPRMTVFVKVGDNWKWLAHVNMKPLKK